jgi:ABC-type glycerol-3-phosphate transport system substrate-binding protein
MDAHANLWHVNMELMAAAGLVDDAGAPILPSSADELLEHAAQMKDATGANYLAADFAQFPIGVRLVMALVWQQGSELFDADRANVSSPEAERAVETIVSLFEAGYADPRLNYGDSQQSFLDGEAAILVNGTWVVDFYDAQAANPDVPLSAYYVADFPTLFDVPRHLGQQPHVGDPCPRGTRRRHARGRRSRCWRTSTTRTWPGRVPATWPCAPPCSRATPTPPCRTATSTPAPPSSPATW